jgi:GNAT superfamily N-acetyltransferase
VSIDLRIITREDWKAFRALRLRALADSPESFGTTLEQAVAHPPAVWRDRAGGPGPIVLAHSEDTPVGMGGLYLPDDLDGAFVWGMWVEPASRGRGIAARILQVLLARAREVGRPVSLHVTEGNDTARRLYERHGFTATGEWQPLRDGSGTRIATMSAG